MFISKLLGATMIAGAAETPTSPSPSKKPERGLGDEPSRAERAGRDRLDVAGDTSESWPVAA
jgi:hypothetical protein